MNVRKHTQAQSERSIFSVTTKTIDSTDDRGKKEACVSVDSDGSQK